MTATLLLIAVLPAAAPLPPAGAQASAAEEIRLSGTQPHWAAYRFVSNGDDFFVTDKLKTTGDLQQVGNMAFRLPGYEFGGSATFLASANQNSYSYDVGVAGQRFTDREVVSTYPFDWSTRGTIRLPGSKASPQEWVFVRWVSGDVSGGWSTTIETPGGTKVVRDPDGQPIATSGTSAFLHTIDDFRGPAGGSIRISLPPTAGTPFGAGPGARWMVNGTLPVEIQNTFIGVAQHVSLPLGVLAMRLTLDRPDGSQVDCTLGCGTYTYRGAGRWGPGRYQFNLNGAGVGSGHFGDVVIWAVDLDLPGLPESSGPSPPDPPPVTTATLDPPAPTGGAGWYRSPVTVSLDAVDEGSGLAFTEYALDGGDFQRYDRPFTVAADGPHTVTYRSIDRAGNEEVPKSRSFKIDRTPPTTEATLDPSHPDSAREGWYRSAVKVALAAADGSSGVAETRYSLDGGGYRTYRGEFTVDGGGEHTVVFSSSDAAGNVEEPRTRAFKIDRSPDRGASSDGLPLFGGSPGQSGVLGGLARGRAGGAGRRFLISRRAVRVTRRGVVRVRVACRQRVPCRGRLTLRARRRGARGSALVGRRSFRVRAMRRGVVLVSIRPAGRRLLARSRRARVRATATVGRPRARRPWTTRSSFRLSPARAR